MNLQHINIKLFVEGEFSADMEQIVRVFHRWVADQSMEELLIDIADYQHVRHGPGIVLVGHEADYAIDCTGGRYGLLYNRKAACEGSNQDRCLQALQAAINACSLLEDEIAGLKFDRNGFVWSVRDRALAPQTDASVAACEAVLSEFARETLSDADVQLDFDRDPRRLVSATVRLSQPLDFARLATCSSG